MRPEILAMIAIAFFIGWIYGLYQTRQRLAHAQKLVNTARMIQMRTEVMKDDLVEMIADYRAVMQEFCLEVPRL